METRQSTTMEDGDGSTEPMLSPGGENGHYPTTQNGHTLQEKTPFKTELTDNADGNDKYGRWYLASLILKQTWRHMVMTCILSTIVETCCFAQPFLILVIVRGDPPASTCVRYACAAGIILYNLLQSSLRTLSRYLLDVTVLRTRLFLGGLLDSKVSSNGKLASRDPDVMRVLLSLDVERFCQSLVAVDVALVGPMSFLAAFTILFRFDGTAALPAFGFVNLTLMLRICMGSWSDGLLTRILRWTTKRLAIIKEAFMNFEAIKIICLEEIFIEKMSKCSGREMALCWKFVLLSAFGRGVGQVTARISIYLIVIVLLHVDSHLSLQSVILVVSYMRILEYNVFSRLPLCIGSLSQMWHLLQRFQDFLDVRELEQPKKDSFREAVFLDKLDGEENILTLDVPEAPMDNLPHKDSLTKGHAVPDRSPIPRRRESSWWFCFMFLRSWPCQLVVPLLLFCACLTQVTGILVDWWTMKSSETASIQYVNETRWNVSMVNEFKETMLRGDLHTFSLFMICHVIGELLLDALSVYMLTSGLRQLHHGMARGLLYTKLSSVEVLSLGATLNTFSRDFVYFIMYDFHSLYALSMGSLKILSILLFVCIVFPWLVLPSIVYIASLILLTIYTHRKANRDSQQLTLTADTFFDTDTFCFSKSAPQNLRHRWHHLCTIRLWHRLRVNLLTSIFCSCVILHMVVSSSGRTNKWPSALVLIYQITFLNWVQDSIGEYKNNMLPIQRMQKYADFKAEVEEGKGEWCDWPTSGQVTFRQIPQSENETHHCTDLIIPSGQKVGVLYRDVAEGRQFLHALLGLNGHPGGIYLDGLDVTSVSTHSLRTAITVIHPELIDSAGHLRDYLDPRQYFTDDTLWDALDRVSLKEKVRDLTSTLQYDLQAISGQLDDVDRQLVGVARAVLHNSQVVVIWTEDLHTDIRSDYEVQDVIRHQLPQSTRIKMTPSVRRVISCDRILVLEEGSISEYPNPWRLLVHGEPHFEQLTQEVGSEEAAQIRALTQNFYRQATRMDSIPEEDEEEEENGKNEDLR